jgi:hypothetical protein
VGEVLGGKRLRRRGTGRCRDRRAGAGPGVRQAGGFAVEHLDVYVGCDEFGQPLGEGRSDPVVAPVGVADPGHYFYCRSRVSSRKCAEREARSPGSPARAAPRRARPRPSRVSQFIVIFRLPGQLLPWLDRPGARVLVPGTDGYVLRTTGPSAALNRSAELLDGYVVRVKLTAALTRGC